MRVECVRNLVWSTDRGAGLLGNTDGPNCGAGRDYTRHEATLERDRVEKEEWLHTDAIESMVSNI